MQFISYTTHTSKFFKVMARCHLVSRLKGELYSSRLSYVLSKHFIIERQETCSENDYIQRKFVLRGKNERFYGL